MYRVRTSPDADRQLAKLDGSIRVRVAQKIDALAENPRPPGCKKLKGDDNLWRVRAGDYRIVFSIQDDVLLVGNLRRRSASAAAVSQLKLVAVILACASARPHAAAGAPDPSGSPHDLELGLGARFMPTGSFVADPGQQSYGAYPALGGRAFVDLRLTPVWTVGLDVAITGNVIPRRPQYQVATLGAAGLRVMARVPASGRFEPFAALSAGVAAISVGDDSTLGRGALFGGFVGVAAKLDASNRVFGQLGYERGFETLHGAAYAPSYVIMELGWRLAL